MMRSLLVLAATLVATGVSAKECRVKGDAPPGVRVPPAPGCPARSDASKQARSERVRTGRETGFIDLGNGTQLRVSGRVRVEMGGRP